MMYHIDTDDVTYSLPPKEFEYNVPETFVTGPSPLSKAFKLIGTILAVSTIVGSIVLAVGIIIYRTLSHYFSLPRVYSASKRKSGRRTKGHKYSKKDSRTLAPDEQPLLDHQSSDGSEDEDDSSASSSELSESDSSSTYTSPSRNIPSHTPAQYEIIDSPANRPIHHTQPSELHVRGDAAGSSRTRSATSLSKSGPPRPQYRGSLAAAERQLERNMAKYKRENERYQEILWNTRPKRRKSTLPIDLHDD